MNKSKVEDKQTQGTLQFKRRDLVNTIIKKFLSD